MKRYFKAANGVSAGQIAHCIARQKKNDSGFARCFADLA